MTNAEKIRNMNKKDFAEFMEKMFRMGANCANNTSCELCGCEWCEKHMTISEWLQNEE